MYPGSIMTFLGDGDARGFFALEGEGDVESNDEEEEDEQEEAEEEEAEEEASTLTFLLGAGEASDDAAGDEAVKRGKKGK
jgi:hypothetical protein